MAIRNGDDDEETKLRELGSLLPPVHDDGGPAQGAEVAEIRAMGEEEEGHGPRLECPPPGRFKPAPLSWRSLIEEHKALAEQRWTPPPPMEMPVIYQKKLSGAPKLSDDQVGYAREQARTRSIKDIAKEMGVKYMTVYNAVRGVTYRHLNGIYPPQW